MPRLHFDLADAAIARLPRDLDLAILTRPCRPRILIVVDGLSFETNNDFGLTRFLEGITVAAGVTTKPVLTLVHRFGSPNASVTIGPDNYNITSNFRFDTANPAVTLANYDQIWLFGIDDGPFYLSDPEVAVIATFMNGGGGLFATGDHERLGLGLCGELPRVRHMRDWSSVPMGIEPNVADAVRRIDTIVDPGANNFYEFDDQSDEIPQRIYPNYQVRDLGAGNTWDATVHPLLMLPGAVVTRTTQAHFMDDIDVLPDHPHESVCAETPAGVLAGNYNINGQNFVEYQPLVGGGGRAKAEVVAYGVSGGRAILRGGGLKPPVRPQMFPIISAYDGRLAQPYSGTVRPGRIVCDSTWHHYVNTNLDGTGTARTGLGTGVGNAFVPGPHLLKIYAYYRNIVKWLQPANRIWCRWWWDLVVLRYHGVVLEELPVAKRLGTFDAQVALGRTAASLLELQEGSRALDELIAGVLLDDPDTEALGDLFQTRGLRESDVDPDELKYGMLGGALIKLSDVLPLNDSKETQAVLKRGVEKNVKAFAPEVTRLAGVALAEQGKRAEKRISLVRDQRFQKILPPK